jgi:hypothetical protein
MSGNGNFSTTAEATAILGISKVRLNELARLGKVPRGPGPNQWDLDAIHQALEDNLDVHQASPARGDVAAGSVGMRPAEALPSERIGSMLPRGSQAHAQLLKTQAQAAIEGIKARQLDGKLLDAQKVREVVSGMVIEARAKLLVIGDELADKLAITSDPIACRELVDRRIAQALDDLVEYPPRAA